MKYYFLLAMIYLEVIIMINRISKMIAISLFRMKVIDENELEIYIYGYEVLISSIVDSLIVLIFGVAFHKMILMLIFFTMFISIRIYTGGYHADTFMMCKTVFILICSFLILASKMEVYLILMLFIMMFYNISVFILAPVENVNKLLTLNEKIKYRRISIILSVFWTIIAVITYFNFIEICRSIMLTAFIIAFLMIVGEKKHRKEVAHYEKQKDC